MTYLFFNRFLRKINLQKYFFRKKTKYGFGKNIFFFTFTLYLAFSELGRVKSFYSKCFILYLSKYLQQCIACILSCGNQQNNLPRVKEVGIKPTTIIFTDLRLYHCTIMVFNCELNRKICHTICEASHGAGAQSVTVKLTDCGFNPQSSRWNNYLYLYFHFFAQHAVPPEFGRKWGTECLTTKFLLPTLLWAGYSVKLIYMPHLVCYMV